MKKETMPIKEQLTLIRSLLKEADTEKSRIALLEQNMSIASDCKDCFMREIKENLDATTAIAKSVQDFINNIEDSKTRRVFTMHYLYGWSWQKIAFSVGVTSEAAPRRLHNRYLSSFRE